MHMSNKVNTIIPSKPRRRARFQLTMMKYAFYVTTYQSGGGGQISTHKDVGTDTQDDLIG